MQFEAIFEIITELFITTIGFIILIKIPSAFNFSVGYLIASALSLALTLIFIRSHLTQIFSFFKKDLILPILKSAWPFAVAGVFGVLMGSIDTVIIGWLLPIASVGLYAAAQKPLSLLSIIPGFIYSSLFPFFSKFAHEKNNDQLEKLAKKSTLISLGLALPIVAGGIIIAGPLIRVIYGAEYLNSVSTFQVLLLNMILVFPGTILSGILIAQDKQKIFIKTGAIGAIINIILDLILIPIYGIVGSAIATSAVQIAVNGIYFLEVKKTSSLPIWKDIKKILLATTIMALVTFYMSHLLLPIISIVAVSGFVYFALLFLFKEELINDLRLGLKK
jgi:O-antigen/teichoic acid export membrane protein